MKHLPWIGLLLIAVQAALLWASSGAVAVPLTAVALAGLAVFGVRTPIGSAVFAITLAFSALVVVLFANTNADPLDSALAIFSVTVTRPLAEFFLLWQSLELIRREQPAAKLPNYFPFLCVGTLVCVFDQSSAEIAQEVYLLIAFAVLAFIVILFQRNGSDEAPQVVRTQARRRRIGLSLVLVSTAATWCVVGVWVVGARMVRISVPIWAAESAGFARGSALYVRSGVLGRISQEKRTSPMSVALRVYADRQPGYLRGRIFDTYSNARWFSAQRPPQRNRNRFRGLRQVGPMRVVPDEIPPNRDGHTTFRIGQNVRPATLELEIWNDPQRGEVFFTALGTEYMRGFAKRIWVDENDVIHTGFLMTEPYVVYAHRPPLPTKLQPEHRERLLAPLRGVDPEVGELAKKLAEGNPTTAEKIAAVESFFRDEFEYLETPDVMPGGVDPLSHFILNRVEAHCEYFASGAVALLRMQGVPTRYVTGYVATELEDEYGDYWVARNRHAHAWAEAYDDESGAWTIVEATPGMEGIEESTVDSEVASGEDAAQDEAGATRRSWWAFWRIMWRRSQFPMAVTGILSGLAFLGFRQGLFQRREHREESPELTRKRRQLRRLEWRLRRSNLARGRDETLHQYASRLVTVAGDTDWICDAADFMRDFARLRYRGE